jgi:hypothetical protein
LIIIREIRLSSRIPCVSTQTDKQLNENVKFTMDSTLLNSYKLGLV